MLLRPIITEKSLSEAGRGRFTFAVKPTMTKTQVKRAVEAVWGVKVIKVATIKTSGKTYRTGKRWKYIGRPDGKKAVVTLAPGQKIELFETKAAEK